MIRIIFDDKEVDYLIFTEMSFTHNIDSNFAFKRLELQANAGSSFSNFLISIQNKSALYARVFVKDKLLMEDYVTIDSFPYSIAPSSNYSIRLSLFDRFYSLIASDLVKTRPKNNVKQLLADALKELNYSGSFFKYQKAIRTTEDFIVLNGLTLSDLKTLPRREFTSVNSKEMLGEACSIANVVVISNGFDTLSIEKQNYFSQPVFTLFQENRKSNISSMEKAVSSQFDQTPSRFIILNSSDEEDNNSSIVAEYPYGKPNVQKTSRVSFDAKYQEISKSLNYGLLGITARQNSFVYKSPGVIFDNNGSFFQPNRMVKVFHNGIDEVMNILQYGLSISGSGNIESTFNLTTQNAFDNNATLKQKRILMR